MNLVSFRKFLSLAILVYFLGLEDLTNQVIGEEKDNLYIVTTIDEIQGLILDVYK